MSKSNDAWLLFESLMRNYPLWPCTFSMCKCGREFGRGGGMCGLCAKEKLAKIVGDELANRAENALKETEETWKLIREKAQ